MSIVVDELCFSYCTRAVLTDISFTAERGKLTAVLGANGVGKTTLFRCILGLQKRYKGSICINDQNARGLGARELAHLAAYIPQARGAAFSYEALDMVLMGVSHQVSPLSVPKARELAAAREAMAQLGISHLEKKLYTHLSGGEQQLVLIARALAQQADVLIMDEPVSSLDYGHREQVLSVMRELAGRGYTVLFSTHDPQCALWYADAVLALAEGRVAAFGAPADVMDAGLMERLYSTKVTMLQTDSGVLILPEGRGGAGL